MNSANSTPVPLNPSFVETPPITLEIQGIGPVPSFKNSKQIRKKRDGTRFIASADRNKDWMQRCIRLIGSQLISATQTTAPGTSTAHSAQSSTVSSPLPLGFDDSRQWIPEIIIRSRQVPKGQEGATLTIERLS
ncbi:MAG TPA: hypothetical protein VEH27_00820 [Methylomirabilota bacterium]|nr:hypothetical protein [Methylomirabilota bacterium]